MTTSRFQSPRRLLAVTALAVAALAGAAQPVGAAGIRNCVDITGKQISRVGCFENVWANGAQHRMTFSNQGFDGATPKELDPFYVIAAQTDVAQGPMATFPHDHVVRAVPAGNHGTYSTKLQGFFVLCSGEGIVSGACVPAWITPPGAGLMPFAQTVNGHALTSVAAVEAAADAGSVALINLGPTAVIVGSITAN